MVLAMQLQQMTNNHLHYSQEQIRGGKTTLLELLAHTCILAHMGLPVPAKRARVGKVESLHILAKAGGLKVQEHLNKPWLIWRKL